MILAHLLLPFLPFQDPAPIDTTLVRAAFDSLHAGQTSFVHLAASYEQRRTTPLSKKPLVSSGRMLFRKEPGCLVFEARLPRPARILLDTGRYQVLRPESRQLERFLLEDSALARALFEALSGRLTALEKDFRIESCTRDREDNRIVEVGLEPRSEDVKRAVTRLWVCIRLPEPRSGEPPQKEGKDPGSDDKPRQGDLLWIAYRDAQGDRVEIRLTDLTLDPTLPKDAFEIDPPPGTKILEHKVPAHRNGR